MIAILRSGHMWPEVVRTSVVSYRCDGVVPITQVTQGDMRMRNTCASSKRSTAGLVRGNVNNLTVLGVMGHGGSFSATEEEGSSTEIYET
jgi:hypothetical protein